MPPAISKAKLIHKLQVLGRILGRTPTAFDTDSTPGFSSHHTYIHYFGSWNNSLVQAGYEVNQVHYIESKILNLHPEQASHTACALDTDGYIGICVNRGYLEPKVIITNNHLGFLEHKQREVGGGIIREHNIKHLRPSHNRQFVLAFRVEEMRDLLPQVLPFLIIKKERAVEVLNLLEDRK